ncbi:60S ribosomal protein L28 [Biomphalaria glabrata]|uniref:Large ribosomal subunit protein eL28 n=2 Tax=Biomphalaria TaxID=6525 RepID=A0A2C9K4P8_BIOGL|nr:60S ribosomal protein L28-like [Biomphalaria glabrata]KAI8748661.1 60S ribosomal protein L28-like [Biomphalaria glabrata]KAI8770981.1 60S ribosomal protein L28 [Biomphalaria glabrata]KAI8782367.1 60S ribosomal protein L28 [Biomphalaria glabrata]KAK0065692.1 60S ribosomal protein L28 [Biomphalaria pfeifferi]
MATADVCWLIIRNNSSTLLKRSKQNMSLEPNNLKSKNSFRYNGLIHRKTIGVEPAKDGKGVVLVTKKSKGLRKPRKTLTKVELKKGPRSTIATIRNSLKANNYRKDLINSAVRRTCAILKSQKPVVIKSRARTAKKE